MRGHKTIESFLSIRSKVPSRGLSPSRLTHQFSNNRSKTRRLIFYSLTCFFALHAAAATPYARIHSPPNGAVLRANAGHTLTYEIDPGTEGNHVHVVIDGREVAVLRKRTGIYRLQGLASGPHEICLKVANKAHVPIGIEHCVQVVVEK
ncbi:hypothetical protein [Pelomicrobium sp.]|jgi:hypothetical protein|uniref:hypothetical protein n=1 Tax=Pelomicrobium sp. TaxID=2815319 RepID=UPI002FDE709E